jgi:tetraacyldisaccharide 4'-kinase
MASEAPPFWWDRPDWRSALLWPVSAAYGAVAARRLHHAKREPTGVPVLCVGNPTVGGAGKTPVAIALAGAARREGYAPGFVSRGHGGSLGRPHLVDPGHDSAKATGDEPLLLARVAPTAVSPNRAGAAKLLIEEGCDFLIMDDGFQSARIRYDYALLVIDAARGLGNGRIIPGGPVRAPLIDQLRHADAVLRMGRGDAADAFVRAASRAARPVYDAVTRPRAGSGVEGRNLLAFAGIGDPSKFFRTVEEAGGRIAARRTFPDHHYYTEENLADLLQQADREGLDLTTTAKDAVRIRPSSSLGAQLLARLNVVEIDVVFDLPDTAATIVRDTALAFQRTAFSAAS